MSVSLLALFNDLGHQGRHMYSVMISTGGGLFIISLLDIKIEIESRCQIEGPRCAPTHEDIVTDFIQSGLPW